MLVGRSAQQVLNRAGDDKKRRHLAIDGSGALKQHYARQHIAQMRQGWLAGDTGAYRGEGSRQGWLRTQGNVLNIDCGEEKTKTWMGNNSI